jgi:hypothetical protein
VTDPTITDLRRELEKARYPLIDAQSHLATHAQLIRDQAALAQVRLLIAANRRRLELADPILLGKLERAVAQVGELESAEAGEQR